MTVITGLYNTAKVYTDYLDEKSAEQIKLLCDLEFTSGSKIRLMPDVHAGAGCTIGTTMTIKDKIVPNLVGVDIGCGMETVVFPTESNAGKSFDPEKLDKLIYAQIPCGREIRDREHPFADNFTTVHNYIDTDAMILRKGAVSAKAGEKLLIPINMRDGSLVCEGLGNPDWNYSAPHGAGRKMSRSKAFKTFSVDEFKESMRGIYSTSVSKDTLDESPFAYKDREDIIANIEPTAKIVSVIKPVYNFKAAE